MKKLVKFLKSKNYLLNINIHLSAYHGTGNKSSKKGSVTDSKNCYWSCRSPTPGFQDTEKLENISSWPPEPLYPSTRCSDIIWYYLNSLPSAQREAPTDQRGGRERLWNLFFEIPPGWRLACSSCFPLPRASIPVVKPSLIGIALAFFLSGNNGYRNGNFTPTSLGCFTCLVGSRIPAHIFANNPFIKLLLMALFKRALFFLPGPWLIPNHRISVLESIGLESSFLS